jgi:iron complex transport system substrate-binding protein
VAEPPDVYLVTDDTGLTPQDVAARPGFAAIRAVAEGRVEVVDGDLVTRPGPRIVEGLELLARLLRQG